MKSWLAEAWSDFLTALFPAACLGCERLGQGPFCELCEVALLPARPFVLEGIDRVSAAFEYGGPLQRVIWRFKYEDRPQLGRPLGQLLRQVLPSLPAFDVVMPIPLAPSRLVKRGYNQSYELALGLSAGPIVQALARKPADGRQVGRSRDERRRSVEGAFYVPARRSQLLAGRRVLVVDDVITTGATMSEAAVTLRANGASAVFGVAICHAEAAFVGRRSDEKT